MCINGDEDDASARLWSMSRKMRNLFETFLGLNDEEDFDEDEEGEDLDGDDEDEKGDGNLNYEVLELTSLVFHTPTKSSPKKKPFLNRFLAANPDNL
ncbi:hypothetical protein BGX21_003464 [Mortierella sp. AD011]|nr:hypothetical protein BGX21_003464 [Mortierella sp. AD011]